MKKMHIYEYIKQFDKPLVSPIWGGEQAFHFLCLGHLDISKALGFELEQATPVLTVVKAGQMKNEEMFESMIKKHEFDYSIFENEVIYLKNNQELFKDKLSGGGCFGPLTIVSGILGAENMLRMIAKKPEFVERFVSYVTEYLVELAEMEAACGQDLFWIAEPLASLLSPKRFWRFSGQYLKKIFEAAHAPGFLHVCGKTTNHTKLMVMTGAEVLSIDSCTDIGECMSMVDETVVLMGNVSPATLKFGTADEVRSEIREIYKKCNGYKNLILSTGCSIMDGTPDENMQVMFEVRPDLGSAR